LASSVGILTEHTARWECKAGSVEDCIDQWVWNPRLRSTLLDPRLTSMGLATQVDTTGITVVAVFAGE
jgi:hypothetical protein